MENAFDLLFDILLDYGLSQKETIILLARFLEEEAYDYIKCMELCNIDRIELAKEKLTA